MATKFNKDAGRFLDSSEVRSMKDAYRDRKLATGLSTDDYIRSEYFGVNQIKELINHPDCVGLRIHHAKRWEDIDGNPTEVGTGLLKPRVLLTAVNTKGKNIAVKSHNTGLKDMQRGGDTLGDGLPCPRHCGDEEDN